jgi:ABC-type antimicrobial peptide transport system permease subunit
MLIGSKLQRLDVIGVTRDAFFNGFTRNTQPNYVFRSEFQEPSSPGEATFYVRYTGSLDAAVSGVSRALLAVAPNAPVVSTRTMEMQLQSQKWPVMAISTLLIVFAIGSLAIAVMGQYAVVAFSMRRRTRDFGVRIALGASSRHILRSVLGEGLGMTAAGLLSGVALSVAASQLLRGLLYGVGPIDAHTYLAVSILLTIASLTACYLPARRATRIDPAVTLRAE